MSRWTPALAGAAGLPAALALQAWERRHWQGPLIGWELVVYAVTFPLVTWLLWRVAAAATAAWSAPAPANPGSSRWQAALQAGAEAARHPLALLLVTLLLIDLRVLHLSADPPVELGPSGGAWTDPGEWAHNARNKVLLGQWVWDEVNFMYVSPLVNLCFYLVFLVLGVGYAQVGLVSVLFSLTTFPLFYASLRESLGRGGALLATGFLGGSYLFVMYNRVGLMETPAVFFQVAALYFGQRGVRDARFFALCGAASLVLLAVKMQMAYIFPAALLSVLLVALGWPRQTGRRPTLRPLAYFLGGAVAALGILGVAWLIPYWEPIAWRLENESRLHTLPGSVPRLLQHVFNNPFVSYFLGSPVLLGLSGVFLCVLLIRLLAGHGRVPFPHLFAFWWFAGGFSYLAIVQYRPLRYYVSLIPPMAIFAASAVVGLWRARCGPARAPRPLAVWVTAGALFVVGLTAVGYAYARVDRVQRALAFLSLYPLTEKELAIATAALALGLSALAFRLLGPWLAERFARVPPWASRGLAAALVVLFIVTEGSQYLDWKLHREYKLVSISRALGATLPRDSVIAGIYAPALTLENPHRALAIWDRYGNWQGDPLTRFGVTHVAVMAYIDEIGYYQRRFPEAMSRARLLDEWILWKTRVSLYELDRRGASP